MALKKYKDKFNSKGYNMTYTTNWGLNLAEWTQNIIYTTSWGLNLIYWVNPIHFLHYKLGFEPCLLSEPKNFKIHHIWKSLYYFLSFKTIRKKITIELFLFYRFFYPTNKDLRSFLFPLIHFDQCIYFDVQKLIQ